MKIPKMCPAWGKRFILPVLLGILFSAAAPRAHGQAAPRYKVDPSWPKELPKNWIIWNATGLVVDKDDHIWVQHHPRQVAAQDAGAAFNPPTGRMLHPGAYVYSIRCAGQHSPVLGRPRLCAELADSGTRSLHR